MTHEHKDGCCGGAGKEQGAGCCSTSSNWVTWVAVIVAIGALVYAGTHSGGKMGSAGAKPKVDVSTLIEGQDVTVATINGKPVKKSDVALAIRDMGANVPPKNIDQIIPAFLEQYVNLQLINDAAEKAGTEKEADVQAQIANARDQIVRAAYLKSLFDGKIADDQLKAAYKAKYEDQPMPEEVHARHILVDSEDKARDLIAQLDHGANFEKLASDFSKDPSSARGGDLGYFTKGEMVKEFGDAAFALKPGQITQQPVKTQFGWHVIEVLDKRQRAKPSFEEAKAALEQEARQAILDGKIQDLRKNANIVVEDAGKPQQGAAGAPVDGSAPADPTAAPAPAPAPAQ
ncbi:MAG: peptidylprolyl isomerase [Rhodospirillales bacterium]|nr:peptidylprolyl isomerase [Alphaproteobacteria bacterium]MCB9987245.1 peptidylprolyl isomerase [Rhodospirillales bacterium]USO07894.1 MAG: peptidylprolyl isomerase [Rhodospirillales bacterium]